MLGGILVSEAVRQKCTADLSAPGSQRISEASARPDFELMPAADLARLDSAFAQGSGCDEIAVLACAAQRGLIAMLDERPVRRIAQRLHIALIGSGAVLVHLKLQGQIASVRAALEFWRLHGCFVSAAGQQDIVIQAGGLVVWKKAKDR